MMGLRPSSAIDHETENVARVTGPVCDTDISPTGE
jgi:hypothetical protein